MNLQLRYIFLLGVLISVTSCKNDKKETDISIDPSEKQINVKANPFDKEVQDALYNGYFIKNESGYDVVILDETLYLLKANASEEQKTKHFFLHIIPSKSKFINLDFPASNHLINDKLSKKFDSVQVYKIELPEVNGPFNINVGQFEGNSRSWESYIQVDLLNLIEHSYKNEYVEYTPGNQFLEEFKLAFDEGYFMKHQEGYDLLLDQYNLYYILSNREDSNLDARFFLHVKFDDREEMLNLDFFGKSYRIDHLLGKDFKSFIVIKREIPNHGNITEFGTGQFINDERLWSYVYHPDKMYEDMAFIYDDQYGTILN